MSSTASTLKAAPLWKRYPPGLKGRLLEPSRLLGLTRPARGARLLLPRHLRLCRPGGLARPRHRRRRAIRRPKLYPVYRDAPPGLLSIAQLDLRDCSGIRQLPETLQVSSWIDLAGTAITSLPAGLNGVQLRWRGVPVDARIAFFPETITAEEVLAEANAGEAAYPARAHGLRQVFVQGQRRNP